jgi:hypothetical protein
MMPGPAPGPSSVLPDRAGQPHQTLGFHSGRHRPPGAEEPRFAGQRCRTLSRASFLNMCPPRSPPGDDNQDARRVAVLGFGAL